MTAMLPKADVLGVGVTLASPMHLVQEIGKWIQERGPARSIAAVNVHTLMEARRSLPYRTALNDAGVSFVDGVPIRWLMESLGVPPPPRVHGADLMSMTLDALPEARHLFYGSTPEVLESLVCKLKLRYPGLKVVGTISPPFRKEVAREPEETIRRLNETGADILWVALGAPKQELWAFLNRPTIQVPVIACVGAAFEIHAGRFNRAPRTVQLMGLEWAWRLKQDPRRLWRRYFTTNGRFLTLLLEQFSRRLFRLGPREPSSGGS